MPPNPITLGSYGIDLSQRFAVSVAVVASPTAAAETIIAQVTIPNFGGLAINSGVLLYGWAAYTVGTNGTAVQLKLRQTNVSGSTVAATGALTGSQHGAAILSADDINGFDSGAGVATYVMTMQVTAGSATSTVSAVFLQATAV